MPADAFYTCDRNQAKLAKAEGTGCAPTIAALTALRPSARARRRVHGMFEALSLSDRHEIAVGRRDAGFFQH